MIELRNDIRHAMRRWITRPGLALTATLTLAHGIGTTTAIVSIVDGVLLRPLPYAAPERLVTFWVVFPQWRDRPSLSAMWDRVRISWLDLRELEANARSSTIPAVVASRVDPLMALRADG